MNQRTEQEIMKHWEIHDKPLVSICCTAYNHELYITEAIDSFLMQETDFPFEVLVHDDCSTDDTANIIREYEKKYPNIIKPIYQKENQYSKGVKITPIVIKKSVGKYIALCEGDDYWTDPEKLQTQLDLMLEKPECYLSFHPADEVINGKLSGRVYAYHEAENRVFTDMEMIKRIGGSFCPTASMVFHREVMDPTPDFFATVPTGDHFVQLLASLNGGALFIARKMSVYRRGHPGSWTMLMHRKDRISIDSLIKNREKHLMKYIRSVDAMGNFIDQKYRKKIDKKISKRLVTLSILYLGNYRYKAFQEMIVQSHETYRIATPQHAVLYYFRFAPSLLRMMIRLGKTLQS